MPTQMVINEATQIPLWWFFVALFALVAGIFTVSMVAWQTFTNSRDIAKLENKDETIFSAIEKVDSDVKEASRNLRHEMDKAIGSIRKDIGDLRSADNAQVMQLASMREENLRLLMTIREDIAVIKAKLETGGVS